MPVARAVASAGADGALAVLAAGRAAAVDVSWDPHGPPGLHTQFAALQMCTPACTAALQAMRSDARVYERLL